MKRSTETMTKNFLMEVNRLERALAKYDKTFTREFPLLGEMTAKGASEKECEQWDKEMPFLLWKEAKVSLQGVSTPADIDARVRQYSLAMEHSDEIAAAFESHQYVMAFTAMGEDVLAKSGHPFITIGKSDLGWGVSVNVFYTLEDGCVDLTIKDGMLVRVSLSVGNSIACGKKRYAD